MSGNEKGNKLTSKSTSRMANLELLRCIAMMMVVVLHYLGKGKILPDLTGASLGVTGTLAWCLECFCIVAVNTYMFISGYFLCMSDFKPGRLVKLYLQVWFYSVGVAGVALLTGVFPLSELTTHDILTMIFPVSMGHYWFITAYVFMYLLLPFVGAGIRNMSRKQMQITIGFLLFFYCIVKSVLPVRLEKDALGYDGIWYLCVFLVAAYVRKFGCKLIETRKRAILLYVAGCLCIFGMIMGLRMIYLETGSLGRIIKVSLEYNHVLPLLAAVGLFGIFYQSKISGRLADRVVKIAPYTLGVYLLHENIGILYRWQLWFGADKVKTPFNLFTNVIITVVIVFVAGILIERIRAVVMGWLHKILLHVKPYRYVSELLTSWDKTFTRQE